VQRQPGANVIEVVDRVKQLLPQLQASLPARSRSRAHRPHDDHPRLGRDVQFELLLAVALVVMVIFLFLRNVPATIIPSVAVPLSLVGTFGVMYLAGFSHQQPDADGADDRHRLRRRRRHRDDREHRALHRGRRAPLEAALKGASRSASRSSR
jgi:hypothetical protein